MTNEEIAKFLNEEDFRKDVTDYLAKKVYRKIHEQARASGSQG